MSRNLVAVVGGPRCLVDNTDDLEFSILTHSLGRKIAG